MILRAEISYHDCHFTFIYNHVFWNQATSLPINHLEEGYASPNNSNQYKSHLKIPTIQLQQKPNVLDLFN